MMGSAPRAPEQDFGPDISALFQALAALVAASDLQLRGMLNLPLEIGEVGLGATRAIQALAPIILGQAARLDGPMAMAHMDPPTPVIARAGELWNASLNQNMLHPATSPAARLIEA